MKLAISKDYSSNVPIRRNNPLRYNRPTDTLGLIDETRAKWLILKLARGDHMNVAISRVSDVLLLHCLRLFQRTHSYVILLRSSLKLLGYSEHPPNSQDGIITGGRIVNGGKIVNDGGIANSGQKRHF